MACSLTHENLHVFLWHVWLAQPVIHTKQLENILEYPKEKETTAPFWKPCGTRTRFFWIHVFFGSGGFYLTQFQKTHVRDVNIYILWPGKTVGSFTKTRLFGPRRGFEQVESIVCQDDYIRSSLSDVGPETALNCLSNYCWWRKSCTTQHVWSLVNTWIFTISTGAGFLASTVSSIQTVKTSVTCSYFWREIKDTINV